MNLRASAIALAALLAGGCGGNEFTTAPADASASSAPNAVTACGDNAHARCTRIQACSPAILATTYVDEGTCETRLKLNCLNALAAPGTGNTPAASEACAVAYSTEACTDYLDDKPPAACVQQPGARAAGQACGFPGQCQSGFCAIVPGSTCGTCAPVPQAGDSCAKLTTCGQLLDCYQGTCITFAAEGAPCNKGQLCGAGLWCVGSTSTANGTCQPAVEDAGAPCDPTGRNGSGCDRNATLACNSMMKACGALQLAAAGQPCGTVNNQLALCGGAGTCTAVPMADGGLDAGVPIGVDAGADAGAVTILDAAVAASPAETCMAPALDGQPCGLVTGPLCISPARCVSGDGGATGTCEFPDPTKCQ